MSQWRAAAARSRPTTALNVFSESVGIKNVTTTTLVFASRIPLEVADWLIYRKHGYANLFQSVWCDTSSGTKAPGQLKELTST